MDRRKSVALEKEDLYCKVLRSGKSYPYPSDNNNVVSEKKRKVFHDDIQVKGKGKGNLVPSYFESGKSIASCSVSEKKKRVSHDDNHEIQIKGKRKGKGNLVHSYLESGKNIASCSVVSQRKRKASHDDFQEFRVEEKGKYGDNNRCVDGAMERLWSEDVMREILYKLPLYALSSFKVVCKRWMELVSDPIFTANYLAENPILLGFSYAILCPSKRRERILEPVKFIPLAAAVNCCPRYCRLLRENMEESRSQRFYSDCLSQLQLPIDDVMMLNSRDLNVCSSDGIILQLHIRNLAVLISLQNPVTSQTVFLPKLPHIPISHAGYASYGLITDFLASQPQITVVEVIKRNHVLRVNTFSSATCKWKTQDHYMEASFWRDTLIARRGVHLNGVIYWPVRHCGVVAYDIQSESFDFSFFEIPNPSVHDMCFCNEMKHLCSEPRSNIGLNNCMCQFLGQSQDCVCYIRTIGHSEISVCTLDRGEWSDGRCYTLLGLPVSLAYGRILSVDLQDCKLLYIRLKTKIFSYHLEFHQLEEIHTMRLDSAGDDHSVNIAPIIPHEAPKLPASILLQDCFTTIFGSSLCHKDACWGDQYTKYLIYRDAHVHSISDPEIQFHSGGNERSWWFESQCAFDQRTITYGGYLEWNESVTL